MKFVERIVNERKQYGIGNIEWCMCTANKMTSSINS